jgi:hypothetical protein
MEKKYSKTDINNNKVDSDHKDGLSSSKPQWMAELALKK